MQHEILRARLLAVVGALSAGALRDAGAQDTGIEARCLAVDAEAAQCPSLEEAVARLWAIDRLRRLTTRDERDDNNEPHSAIVTWYDEPCSVPGS
jgi:hypothetical protein